VNTYQKLVEKFGHEDRKKKCIEELSELIRAIARDDRQNYIEESAQVKRLLIQLNIVFNVSHDELMNQDMIELKKLEELL